MMMLLTACAGQLHMVTGEHPPAWLSQPSAEPNNLCAVGVSGPTYYAEDAMAYSKANAWLNLAQQIKTHIRATMDFIQREGRSGRSEIDVEEQATFDINTVIKVAEVRNVWVNELGRAWGEQGSVYTRVCIAKDLIPK